MFQRDLAQAKPIGLEEWRRRPLEQRLLELFEVTSLLCGTGFKLLLFDEFFGRDGFFDRLRRFFFRRFCRRGFLAAFTETASAFGAVRLLAGAVAFFWSQS